MNKTSKGLGLAIIPLLLAGCASTDRLDNADRNQFVTEFYAMVSGVNSVKFESHVGPAVAVGAVGGALDNADRDSEAIIGGAIIGGLFTGLLTAIFEGSNDGFEYELDAVDGDRVTVVVDYQPANIGDCVKVRVSGSVNIYKQPLHVCEDAAAYQDDYLESE